MNHKEMKKREIEVLAKLSKLDISKAKLNIRKCFPYSNNCYEEATCILYHVCPFYRPEDRYVDRVITVCKDHLEEYQYAKDWYEL